MPTMTAVRVTCPTCDAPLKLAATLPAGKRLKCPKCASPFTVPAPYEAVEEDAPPAATPARGGTRRVTADRSADAADRPRRNKKGKKPAARRSLVLPVAGVALVAALVAVGGAVWAGRSRAKDGAEAPAQAKAGAPPGADTMKIVAPRARFQTTFPTGGSDKPEVNRLLLTPDGRRAVASNLGSDHKVTEVWSLDGEPKKHSVRSGRLSFLSPDGKWMGVWGKSFGVDNLDLETGEKMHWGQPGPRRAFDQEAFGGGEATYFRTPDLMVMPSRNTDPNGGKRPFLVHEVDLKLGRSVPAHVAGDDDRVVVSAPVRNGRELVYGLPVSNAVRVYDFAERKVTREFPLADPRPYRGVGKGSEAYAHWYSFAVSADGKWITADRVALGQEPDPLEIFDGTTGAVVAALDPRQVSKLGAVFVPDRDVLLVRATGGAFRSNDVLAYDIKARAFVAAFRGEGGYANQLAVSADGKTMATGYANGEVRVWDLSAIP